MESSNQTHTRLSATLRSIDASAGATLGAALGAGFVGGILLADMALDVSGPTQLGVGLVMIVLPVAMIGTVLGAALGLFARLAVKAVSTPLPPDPTRWMNVAAVVAVLSATVGASTVIPTSRARKPRVIESTGAVARLAGDPTPSVTNDGVPFGARDLPLDSSSISWQGDVLRNEETADTMTLYVGDEVLDRIDIGRLPYVSGAWGATADLAGVDEDWLAVLVRLRATSHRELFAVYDPSGERVLLELIDRSGVRDPDLERMPPLQVARMSDGQEVFVLNLGQRIHYGLRSAR